MKSRTISVSVSVLSNEHKSNGLDSNNVCPERFLKGPGGGRVSPDNLQRPPFREVLGKKGHASICRRPNSRETSCAFSTKTPVLSQLTRSSCPGSGLIGESFMGEQTKILLLTVSLFWLRRLCLIDTLFSVQTLSIYSAMRSLHA